MGEKDDPWCHWPSTPWKLNVDSSASNPCAADIGLDNTNSVKLLTYPNTHVYIYSGVAAPVPFFTASVADRPLPVSSRFVSTLAPNMGLSRTDPPNNRSLVFCQNEKTSAGPFLRKRALDPVPELQGSNETNVTDFGAQGTDDTHENTEEINALLDSDSDEGYEKVHEFNKAKKSPVDNDTLSVESVASAGASVGAAHPTKKRKLSSDTDRSVVDTASSARPGHSNGQKHPGNDDDAQSCCIGEVESDRKFALTLKDGEEAEGDSPDDRKLRIEKIQETVAALRKIVPGGIAKDATTVLDEAISYLTSLKLKVKTLGAVSL
ncbi:transcription factor bHLH145 [Brachypodium distachyon]|uniref:BHLH domain-containing protein n=1 Tax=Brachypodium distachyon TaxID=15368 RepID=I1H4V1_BRADI|nr:transcription factor bHLH145 [Brachypodium distachyon]KQK21424.1 hypothetical protein BRADI_1g60670v3 [Brachypodium distachyon]|eukprot:XP_003557777.1 transcription factor bHLH145 [Brachypodium distachyon]